MFYDFQVGGVGVSEVRLNRGDAVAEGRIPATFAVGTSGSTQGTM